MIQRNLHTTCFSADFGSQMRFIAGPRQAGKTTLAQQFLKEIQQEKLYFNWDYRETRLAYQKDPDYYLHKLLNIESSEKYWFCFDEIHKYPKWKDILKEVYDKYGRQYHFIITGSARLDLFRKSGDSLAGRYFLFKLFPLALNELTKTNKPHDDNLNSGREFIEKRIASDKYFQNDMESLLKFSGFPDPFLAQKENFHNKWKTIYLDRLIQEDLREISQVTDLENVSQLIMILPDKVGSPLSVNSLRNDMLVSYNALKNYVSLLELAYITFLIKPYSRSISRSIKKEKKLYYFDWTYISAPPARFENYIAVELKALIEMWNDLGHNFDLNYLRTKDGKESDFLLIKDNQPWLIIEVKFKKQKIEHHHYHSAQILGNIPVLQIVMENKVAEKYENGYQVSASRFFA